MHHRSVSCVRSELADSNRTGGQDLLNLTVANMAFHLPSSVKRSPQKILPTVGLGSLQKYIASCAGGCMELMSVIFWESCH